MRSGQKELYKLDDDIGETNDVSALYPDKAKELVSQLSIQLRKWKAPMPVLKKTGKALPMPDVQ